MIRFDQIGLFLDEVRAAEMHDVFDRPDLRDVGRRVDQDFAIAFEHRGFRLRRVPDQCVDPFRLQGSQPARRGRDVDHHGVALARPPRRNSSRTKSPADPPMSFTAMFLPFRLAMRAANGLSGLRPACSRNPFLHDEEIRKPLQRAAERLQRLALLDTLRDVPDAGAADFRAAADHAGDHVRAGADVDDRSTSRPCSSKYCICFAT